MVPLERDDSIDADKQQLMNIKIEMLSKRKLKKKQSINKKI